MKTRKQFAQDMKIARAKQKGVSQRIASEIVGVHKTLYCNWENGRSYPSESNRRKICEMLGLDFKEYELNRLIHHREKTDEDILKENPLLKGLKRKDIVNMKTALEKEVKQIHKRVSQINNEVSNIYTALKIIKE
jgi:transcriptional regulator with XRE-family HTH domain